MASHLALTRRHFLALGSALLAPPAARAQSTPIPATTERMMVSAILPELPSVTVDAWFARFAVDPGVEIPAFDRDGAALMLVRSGGVTLASDRPVVHRRTGETGPADRMDVPAGGLLLPAGEGALIADATQMAIMGADGEPADVLLLVVHSRANDDASGVPGVTSAPTQILGAGPLTFHTGGAVMIVEHDVVNPGASDYSATFQGTEFGSIEAGDARVLCQRGMTWRTPGGHDVSGAHRPGQDPVETGSSMQFGAGDAYASYDGSLVWRAGSDEPLVVLRAQVLPLPRPGTA